MGAASRVSLCPSANICGEGVSRGVLVHRPDPTLEPAHVGPLNPPTRTYLRHRKQQTRPLIARKTRRMIPATPHKPAVARRTRVRPRRPGFRGRRREGPPYDFGSVCPFDSSGPSKTGPVDVSTVHTLFSVLEPTRRYKNVHSSICVYNMRTRVEEA